MADAHRDLLLPPGWIPGAMFRLTEGVRRCEDGALRVNPHGFVHRIYDGPPDDGSMQLQHIASQESTLIGSGLQCSFVLRQFAVHG